MRSQLEDLGGQLVGAMKAGLSLRDACRQVGVNENTARGWLRRGRQESEGPFADFAAAMEAARAVEAPFGPMTEKELKLHIWRAVKRGSVQAMKLYAEILRHEERRPPKTDSLGAVDELAARRAQEKSA